MLVGLTQIKGIGYNFATAILDTLKINTNSNIGNLTEKNVQEIEKLITDPISGNFPTWFLNRRKDIETGANFIPASVTFVHLNNEASIVAKYRADSPAAGGRSGLIVKVQ